MANVKEGEVAARLGASGVRDSLIDDKAKSTPSKLPRP